jgi:heme-degrading monooxygenase HmoA
MFGTIFRVQPRPGHELSVTEYFERWEQQRSGNVPGFTGMTVLRPAAAPGELIGAVVFRDRETHEANAADPDIHSQKRAGVTR